MITFFQIISSTYEDCVVFLPEELFRLRRIRVFIEISFSIKDISVYIAILYLMLEFKKQYNELFKEAKASLIGNPPAVNTENSD